MTRIILTLILKLFEHKDKAPEKYIKLISRSGIEFSTEYELLAMNLLLNILVWDYL
jgi:hypothetical protein